MTVRTSIIQSGSWSRLTLLGLMGAMTLLTCRLTLSGEDAGIDPSAIRRVILASDQVVAHMDRVQQGSLVLLRRADFEARVQQAEAALDAASKPGRLVEAHYHARATGPALVEGTADWRIANPSHTAAVLPIAPFNLAVTRASVDNGSKTGAPAVLGEINGTSLGLLISGDAEQKVHLEWTARGDARSGDWHFSLQVPPSPVAMLDLDLPADRSLMPGEQFLASGPFATDTPSYRRWQIAFSGRSTLELVAQPESVSRGTRSPTLAWLQATQTLEPDLLTGDFDFSIEVPQHPLDSLAFRCDPSLHATDVRGPDISSWQTHEVAADQSEELVIRFRQPFRGGVLHVHCLAPLRSAQAWTAPTVHLRQGVIRGESLTLRVHRDINLDRWQAGAFRFIRPSGTDQESAPTGWQVLTLVRNDLSPDRGLSRPRAELRIGGGQLRLRQWSWWQVGFNTSVLTVQLSAELTRGRRFQLRFAVPAGWRVTDVGPSDRVRRWSTVVDHGRTELAIDFFQPLSPGTLARTLIHLRPSRMASSERRASGERDWVRVIPFPDLVPQQACFREGTLAIRIDPDSEAEAQCRQPAQTVWSSDVEAPWGKQPPNYSYRFRDVFSTSAAPTGLSGLLRLRPRDARFGAHCTERVLVSAGRAVLAVELELRPLAGSPTSVNFFLSSPVAPSNEARRESLNRIAGLVALTGTSPLAALALASQPPSVPTWSWQVKGRKQTVEAQLDRATPIASALQALVGPTGLNTAVTAAAMPEGECWRLPLPERLTKPVVFQTTLEFPEKRIEGAGRGQTEEWTVPLIFIPAASAMEGTVLLDAARLLDRHITFTGHRSGDRLRYSTWPAKLMVTGRPERHGPPDGEIIRHADLTTWVRAHGDVLEDLRCQVRNWRRQVMPVKLPEGARLRGTLVDGRWMVMTTPTPLSSVVNVPMPGDAGWHTVELVYERPGGYSHLWWSVQTTLPELPLPALGFRHTWRLPPGLVPLSQSDFDRLPGWGDSSEGLPRLAHVIQAPWLMARENAEARQSLTHDVEALWRSEAAPGQPWRLGAILERAVSRVSQHALPPVLIDSYALARQNVTAQTAMPPSPGSGTVAGSAWSHLGLSLMAGRSGMLITTQRQVEDWLANGTSSEALPGSVEDALAEASRYGQDASGRFQMLADWLDGSSAGLVGLDSEPPFAPQAIPKRIALDGPWSAWESKPGHPLDQSLILVRERAVGSTGLALAGILFGVWCWLRRFPKRRLRWQLVWLGGAGLALLWLPEPLRPLAWWPGLIAVVLGAGSCGRLLLASRSPQLAIPVAVLLAFLAAGLFLQAAPTQTVTVFILQENPAEKASRVLAPPSLLDGLSAIANRGPAGLHRAVLLSSSYEGAADSVADLHGEFRVYCFGAGPLTLTLPLGNVRIRDAKLDGAAVSLTAVLPPREGYRLSIKGAGVHRLVVDFRVTVADDGDGRDLKFSVPELPESRLDLHVPLSARYVQALGARGAQTLGIANGSVQLKADLGRIAAIHVRWRQPSGTPNPIVHVREGYLWRLRPSGTDLVAVLQYTVSRGAVPALSVELPPGMQVRSVEVDRLPNDDGKELPPRYRDWAVSRADRRLHVAFQEPLVHGAQLTLTLVAGQGLGANPRLTVPAPVDAGPPTAPGVEPLVAYRAEGDSARLTDNLRVTRQDDRTAFQELWRMAGQPEPGGNVNVFSFQRVPGAAPYLQLAMSSPLAIESCVQTTHWQVGVTRADVTTTVDLKAPMHDLILVEWEVGPVIVADVSGSGVRNWSQRGDVVQVWLQEAVGQASFRLIGWVPRMPGSDAEFQVVPLRVRSVKISTGTLEVTASDGLETEPLRLHSLKPLVDPQVSSRRRRYTMQQPDYAGVFRIRRAQPEGTVQLLTAAELREGKVAIDVMMNYQPGPDAESLMIHLWRAEAADVRFDKGPFSIRDAPDAAANGRAWTVMPGAGTLQVFHFRFTLEADPSSEALMPLVTVEGAARVDSWVAVLGPDMHADGALYLTEVRNPEASLKRWPGWSGRFRRGGHVWRVSQPGWRLRLRPHLSVAGPRSARLFLSDQIARLVDGTHWIHEATCLVYQETDTELRIQLPDGAHAIRLSLDGQPASPLVSESGSLHVALAGRQAIRWLQLQWEFEGRVESLERPNLRRPRLRDVTDGPSLWTVYLPANYAAHAEADAGQARAATAAEADLSRARAELELSGVLAQGLPLNTELFSRGLLGSQQRFEWYCRQAGRHLDATPDTETALQRLRERNRRLAEAKGFQRLRAQAERNPSQTGGAISPAGATVFGQPNVEGIPQRWAGPSDASAPSLQLVPRSGARRQRTLAYSSLLVLALVGIGMANKRRFRERAG